MGLLCPIFGFKFLVGHFWDIFMAGLSVSVRHSSLVWAMVLFWAMV
jgi:hypothetical protein